MQSTGIVFGDVTVYFWHSKLFFYYGNQKQNCAVEVRARKHKEMSETSKRHKHASQCHRLTRKYLFIQVCNEEHLWKQQNLLLMCQLFALCSLWSERQEKVQTFKTNHDLAQSVIEEAFQHEGSATDIFLAILYDASSWSFWHFLHYKSKSTLIGVTTCCTKICAIKRLILLMTKYLAFFNNVTNGPKSHNDLLSFHDYHSNEKFTCNHKLIYNFAVCCILFIGN